MPLEERIGNTWTIRQACRLLSGYVIRTWSPEDFGQARMAALGWLLSLAQRQGPAKADDFIAKVREDAARTPANLHAAWEWIYLCQLRFDNAGLFAAARALSRAAATDSQALWIYLHAAGGRQLPLGEENWTTQAKSNRDEYNITPPLEEDELEHLLACYRSLRARRPELARAQILIHVADELARAKRGADLDRFYRDTITGSTRIGQIVGAFMLAGRRGDVDGLIQLVDRYDRLQTGRTTLAYYTGSFTFYGPGLAMSQGMSACADRNAYGDVLRLLDYNLVFARRKHERQSPGAAARALRARNAAQGMTGYMPSYMIWAGSRSSYARFAFPQVNEYFDATVIQVLRTAYELYQREDLLSDLVKHFRQQAESAPTAHDAIYPRLALSSILWWSDDKDEAIAELAKVVEASRPESELRLDLAELFEQQGEYTDALSLVDAVQPLDNMTLKRREELALRVAVLAGDVERARHAAERLFGLRLDTETQIRVSGQMRELGLHELAEAVLGRARRRAGNKAAALLGLMLQYQRQDKHDEAVQVAMQILRSTTATRQANPNVYNPDADAADAARTTSISVLARSNRLPQLIDRASDQLKKTPNSIQIHQALADYYTAAGQNAKARAELTRIAELRPDDARLRFKIAEQLVQDGQTSAAVGHYKGAFQLDPSAVNRSFPEMVAAFQKAGKTEELLPLLSEIDLRTLGGAYYLVLLFQQLPDETRLNEQVVSLYRKAWDAFPDQRWYLICYRQRDEIWELPEMFEHAREVIVPKVQTVAPYVQWYCFEPATTLSSTGSVVHHEKEIVRPAVSRFLDVAAREDKLSALAGEIEVARKTMPYWKAADPLLAMVLCRSGMVDRAKVLVPKVLEMFEKDEALKTTSYAFSACWAIGLELENNPATRDLALTVYEQALNDPFAWAQFRYTTAQIPVRSFVDLSIRQGRENEARRVLVKFVRSCKFPDNYPVEFARKYRLKELAIVAGGLVQMGFSSDAVPLYSEAVSLADGLDTSTATYGIPDLEQLPRRVRDGLNAAWDGMGPAELAPVAGRLIADAIANDMNQQRKDGPKGKKPKPRDQVLDLATLIHPRELDKGAIRSLLAESLAAGDAKQLAAAGESLEALRKTHPDDFSVAIALAFQALASSDSKRIEPAILGLSQLVEKFPLEPLPAGTRANARQRIEAARQVPLWLVARACDGQKSAAAHERGERLAARALEAARRQSEPRIALAMFREQGERALAHSDRAGAEAVWGRMLNMVVAPEQSKLKRAGATRPAAAPAQSRPAPTPGAAHAPARAKTSAAAAIPATRTARSRRRPLVRLASYQQPAAKERAATSAESPADPAAAEEAREQRSMERFLSLLEKNPRRGTALDRVYGYHVERGSLDAFIKSLSRPRRQESRRRHRLADPRPPRIPARPGCRRRHRPPTGRSHSPRRSPALLLPRTGPRPGRPARTGRRRLRTRPRAKTGSQRPPRNLPGPRPRLPAHPEKRPGPPGLEPARSSLPQRPARPGADRLRPRRGKPARHSPCRASRHSPERPPTPSARSSSPCRPPT